MKKKILLWMFAFLFVVSSVHALDVSNAWDFDSSSFVGNKALDVSGNNQNNLTNTSATLNVTTILGQSWRFFSTNPSYGTLDATVKGYTAADFTISVTFNKTTENAYEGFIQSYDGTDGFSLALEDTGAGNRVPIFQVKAGGNVKCNQQPTTTTNITRDRWHNVVAYYNSTLGGCSMWIDNVTQTMGVYGNTISGTINRVGSAGLGNYTGFITDLCIKQGYINGSDRSQLFNNSAFAYCVAQTQTISNLTVTIVDQETNRLINGFNLTIVNSTGGVFFFSSITNSTVTGFLSNNSEPLNISLYTTGINYGKWFNFSSPNYNITISSTSLTPGLLYYKSRINVTAFNFSGLVIPTFSANVTSLNSTDSQDRQTTANNITFEVNWNETYLVTAYEPNLFALVNATLKASAYTNNINFTLLSWNSFNISVFDEITLQLIRDRNVTLVAYLTTIGSYTNTTIINGTGNLTLLMPGEYNFIYSAVGYQERFRYINLANGTFNTISLYLLPITNGSSQGIIVKDQFQNPVVGYVVAARKFIPSLNDFIIVQSEKTNSQGQTGFFLEKGDAQYSFRILNGNAIVNDTSLSKLFTDPTTFFITVGAQNDFVSTALNLWRLGSKINYNNNTNIVQLEWVTLSGVGGTICLNTTYINATDSSLVNSQCSSLPAGNITFNASGKGNGTFKSVGYIVGSTLVTNIVQFTIGTASQLSSVLGQDGLILYIIMIIICAVFIGIYNIQLLPYGLIVAHLSAYWMGIIPINWGISGLAVLLALLVVMKRMED